MKYTDRTLPARRFDWTRYWIRVLVAVVAFNVLMAVLTAWFIFPYLHPAR